MDVLDDKSIEFKLRHLLTMWESETVEFKEASNEYPTDTIGKYFSALANEANLRGVDYAWLVFGVNNKSKKVVGTDYRTNKKRLQSLKYQMQQGTSTGGTFLHIYEHYEDNNRVLLFQIPPAPLGTPVAWQGIWYARADESLVPLDLHKMDKIRAQYGGYPDWSAEIVPGATLDDLDATALALAKEQFSQHINITSKDKVIEWTDETFLQKLGVMRDDGRLTRAALIILGSASSSYLLSPNPVTISWIVRGEEKLYEHFGLPFLISSSRVYEKIRNGAIRILPMNGLIPVEVKKYDRTSILEAIHNAIAHQDYRMNSRISVEEYSNKLIFMNAGDFFVGNPLDYVLAHRSANSYRNDLLVKFMVNLNMIDTIGSGVQYIYQRQADNYLPLPDYDISSPNQVGLTIYGEPLDANYAAILIDHPELSLGEIVTLDNIQKCIPVTRDEAKPLKEKGLIVGNHPGYRFVQSEQETIELTNGADVKVHSDDYYIDLVIGLVKKNGIATRKQINALLIPKLEAFPTKEKKVRKVGNLLTKMKNNELIENVGSKKAPEWTLKTTTLNSE
ncbi:MAG: putative DNA binding domain-containing protein [Clostridiales Family XIII bacterium]|jgi:ATP-dependent DNA helicase RecG|nr:putative DNA binding domain-containing protein [Clostridiales Family XIII bacterium]